MRNQERFQEATCGLSAWLFLRQCSFGCQGSYCYISVGDAKLGWNSNTPNRARSPCKVMPSLVSCLTWSDGTTLGQPETQQISLMEWFYWKFLSNANIWTSRGVDLPMLRKGCCDIWWLGKNSRLACMIGWILYLFLTGNKSATNSVNILDQILRCDVSEN